MVEARPRLGDGPTGHRAERPRQGRRAQVDVEHDGDGEEDEGEVVEQDGGGLQERGEGQGEPEDDTGEEQSERSQGGRV